VKDPEEQRWVRMMQDPKANFFDIQREFNDYWSKHERAKGDGWKAFKRWEYFWERRVLPDGSFPSSKEIVDAVQKKLADRAAKRAASKSNRKQNAAANFTLMGPMNAIPTNGGCGRLNNVAFHPTNTNIMFRRCARGRLVEDNEQRCELDHEYRPVPHTGCERYRHRPLEPERDVHRHGRP
jgi:hypothetical protein